MKILVAGVVIMATISIGGYAISRNVGGEKRKRFQGVLIEYSKFLEY